MCTNTLRNQKGLTLIEILIVVILMGIIAAVAVPRFTSATKDAKENTLDTNLGALRTAIELYASEHIGRYPGMYLETTGLTVTTTDVLAKTSFEKQLSLYSDASGKTSTTKNASFPYGPYFRKGIPENPLPSKSNVVAADFNEVGDISAGGAVGGTGWKVAVLTGQIVANNSLYDDR